MPPKEAHDDLLIFFVYPLLSPFGTVFLGQKTRLGFKRAQQKMSGSQRPNEN